MKINCERSITRCKKFYQKRFNTFIRPVVGDCLLVAKIPLGSSPILNRIEQLFGGIFLKPRIDAKVVGHAT